VLRELRRTLSHARLPKGDASTSAHIEAFCGWVQVTYFDGITTDEHGAELRQQARDMTRLTDGLARDQIFTEPADGAQGSAAGAGAAPVPAPVPEGYRRLTNYGAGDCLFLAVLQCLKRLATADGVGTLRADLHAARRSMALEYDHLHDRLGDSHGYSTKEREFIAKGQQSVEESVKVYFNRMRVNGEDGGELEIYHLAAMLRRPIRVYCDGTWHEYGGTELGEVIHVLYMPDGTSGHYEALIPINHTGPATTKRSDSPIKVDSGSDDGQTCSCCGKSWDGNAQCNCMCEGCAGCVHDFLARVKNHYEVLGLAKKASPKDIKRAYYKLALTHHPDKGGVDANFQRLQHAYEVLSDPTRRSRYDCGDQDEDDSFEYS
jgi:hypothetical protein